MGKLIEALGGSVVTVGLNATINITPPAPKEPAASEAKVKSVKLCQICQKPVSNSRAKICGDPACKREVQRRYNQKYLQRKRTEEELPADDAPLVVHRVGLPDVVIGMNRVTEETADARSE